MKKGDKIVLKNGKVMYFACYDIMKYEGKACVFLVDDVADVNNINQYCRYSQKSIVEYTEK